MSGNHIGKLLTFSSFGESHGPALGGIIDGFPPNFTIDFDLIKAAVKRRGANQNKFSSPRAEDDEIEFLSGIFQNKTIGTPIAFIIRNKAALSSDYEPLKNIYRPSHADFTYQEKYGIRDYRGGGRASARETLARVVAGELAIQFLKSIGIEISAYVYSIGTLSLQNEFNFYTKQEIEGSELRCPDKTITKKMLAFLDEVKANNDSAGGTINCIIKNVPIGLGEPVFDKLQADLAKAMLSINAVKGFEIGSGFKMAEMPGSKSNDIFKLENNKVQTKTNHSGGIQGGISNGMDINFKVAFKAISSIGLKQEMLTDELEIVELKIGGRHDVCMVPRAVPIVESMAAIILLDHHLRNNAYKF